MNFSLELKEFSDKTGRNINDVQKAVALDLFGKVIKSTPVGNPSLWKSKPPKGYTGGRLRGNWQASIDKPATGILSKEDKNGNATIGKMSAIVESHKDDGILWLTNNLPYAMRVEYGWSTQAPSGMVRVTIAAFESAINKAIQRVNK